MSEIRAFKHFSVGPVTPINLRQSEALLRQVTGRNPPSSVADRVDNGPEFISKALDRWAYENGVTLDFSRPGKPTDTDVVEKLFMRVAALFSPIEASRAIAM
jgi:transposase InsO family protein